MALEIAALRLPAVNLSVKIPGPVMTRSVKVANPEALVLAVGIPPSAPGPANTWYRAAVTDTPLVETGLPPASRSWITGCCEKGTPDVARDEGSTVMLS